MAAIDSGRAYMERTIVPQLQRRQILFDIVSSIFETEKIPFPGKFLRHFGNTTF